MEKKNYNYEKNQLHTPSGVGEQPAFAKASVGGKK